MDRPYRHLRHEITPFTNLLRGGSWGSDDLSVRSALRVVNYPGNWNDLVGFRCVRSP